jgi:hypothetical protein
MVQDGSYVLSSLLPVHMQSMISACNMLCGVCISAAEWLTRAICLSRCRNRRGRQLAVYHVLAMSLSENHCHTSGCAELLDFPTCC